MHIFLNFTITDCSNEYTHLRVFKCEYTHVNMYRQEIRQRNLPMASTFVRLSPIVVTILACQMGL
jgi:hypothetical protein